MKQTLFSRILSLMLVMVLIFSMVPASVFATEAENDVDSSQSSGIDPPETNPTETSAETSPESSTSETDPEGTVSNETVPETTAASETVPEDTIPDVTVPEEEAIDPEEGAMEPSEDTQAQESPSESDISVAADDGESGTTSTGAKEVFVRTTVLLDGGSFHIDYNGQSIVKHGIEILAIRDKGSTDNRGTIAYCIEPGLKLGENGYDGSTVSSGDAWAQLSDSQKYAVGLAMLYGAPNGMSASTVKKQIINEIATAMIIHEICIGWRSSTGKMQIVDDNYKAWNYYLAFCSYYDSYIYSNSYNTSVNGATITKEEIDSAYYKLSNALRKHNSLPTFTNGLKEIAPTHVMELQSNGTYKITLTDTDTYSPFKDIDWSFLETEYGLTYSVNGRTLTLTAASFADIPTGLITVEHGDYPSVKESSFIVWGPSDGSGQVTVSVAEAANDPLPMYFKLRGAGGTLKIVKTTSDGNNLAGWKFNIYSDKACTVLLNDTPYVTDENGTITDIPIPVGTVYVKEIGHEDPAIAEIYNCESENPQAVVSVVDGSYEVTFHNAVNKGDFSIVKTTSDGENLEGWQFNFYSDEACTAKVAGPFTSDSNGKISGEIVAGTYWVKEVGHTTSGVFKMYECETNPQQITVEPGATASLTFENKRLGSITVTKMTNTGEDKDGWIFGIWYMGPESTSSQWTWITQKTIPAGSDSVTFTGLQEGYYMVRERGGPEGLWGSDEWICDTTYYKVLVPDGEETDITIWNTHVGSASMSKVSSNGITKEGFAAMLYSKPTGKTSFDITYLKTDADGNFYVTDSAFTTKTSDQVYTITGLADGTYKIREVISSSTYTDSKVESIHVVITNDDGDVVLDKTYTTSQLTTDVVNGITNYATPEFTVSGLGGGKMEVTIQNEAIPGTATVKKVTTDGSSKEDFCVRIWNGSREAGNRYIYLRSDANGNFYVTDENYTEVTQNPNYSITDIFNGDFTICEVIGADQKYKVNKIVVKVYDEDGSLVETNTYSGSNISLANGNEYTINDSFSALNGGGSLEIEITNEPLPSGLQILKSCSGGGRVDGWKIGVYADAACTNPIPGSPFTTDANGMIDLGDIDVGTYYVKELPWREQDIITSANLDYWILDTSVHEVTLKADSTAVVTIENQYVGVLFIQKFVNDTMYDEYGDFPAVTWAFHVWSDTGYDEIHYTDDSGWIEIYELQGGVYYVQEVQLPGDPFWECDTEIYTVTVNGGVTVEYEHNNYYYGDLQIKKVTNTGLGVTGWKFEIRDLDGNLIETITTNSSGIAKSGRLLPGQYNVTEIGGPEGAWGSDYWICDTSTHLVEVVAGLTITEEIRNEQLGRIEIQKSTNTGNNLNGWIFDIYDSSNTIVDTVTTDASGYAISDYLAPGAYTVKERSNGDSYWECDVTAKSVTVVGGENVTVSVQNIQKGRIEVKKTTNTGANLSGWKFEIRNAATNELIETITTNSSGYAISGLLDVGKYKITEVGGASGTWGNGYWICDSSSHDISVVAGTTVTHKAENLHYGKISVQKSTNTGEDLSGWKFEVRKASDNSLVATLTTNANGYAETELLAPGSYKITEVGGASGTWGDDYWICDTDSESITVSAGKTTLHAAENNHMGRIEVQKSTNTGTNLSGWKFEVRNASDNSLVATLTTDASGYAVSDLLEPGSYKITEVGGASGTWGNGYWICDSNSYDITVTAGSTVTHEAENLQYGKVSVQKSTNTGTNLQGWVFQVADSDGNVVATLTTNASGYVESGLLAPGSYTITEIGGPAGAWGNDYWICDTDSATITVSAGKTAAHTAENLHYGKVAVQKATNTGIDLEGWVFEVRNSSNAVVATLTTDKNGYAESDLLPLGSYKIAEIGGPSGKWGNSYWQCDTSSHGVTVAAGATTVQEVKNVQYGRIKIQKNTNTGDTLGGWIFDIYDSSNNLVGTLTTDDSGYAISDYLLPGTYIVQERDSDDEMWNCDVTPYDVVVVAGKDTSHSVTNVNSLNITIVKTTNTGENLSGWQFRVWCEENSFDKTYTTDSNGVIYTEDLLPGEYHIQELGNGSLTSAQMKYWVCDLNQYDANIAAGSVYTHRAENKHMGIVEVQKTTNTGKDLSGWKFEVRKASDNSLVATLTTDTNGYAASGLLEPGAYKITEVGGPAGAWGNDYWVCDTASHNITVTAGSTVTHQAKNDQYGKISVQKTTNTGANLSGWKFEIRKASDNSLVETLTTNASGYAESGLLESGKYIITEVGGASGTWGNDYWICDTASHNITVSAGATTAHTAENDHMGRIEVQKTTNTGKDLDGWKFEIRNASTNALVETLTTDASGYAVSGLLAPGKYTVTEVGGKNGVWGNDYWICDTNSYDITVAAGSTASHEAENNQLGRIEVQKTTNTGKNLDGWIFEIRDAATNALIETLTTDSSGYAVSGLIEPGDYIITEVGGKTGAWGNSFWTCDTNSYDITVVAGATASHEVTNRHYGKVSVQKTTNTGADLSGWAFEVRNADGDLVARLVTNTAGYAESGRLEPGYYTITEVDGPSSTWGNDYWVCDTDSHDITVSAGSTTVHEAENLHYGKIEVQKTTNTGTNLDGWQFRIEDADGNLVETLTTDATGYAVSGLLLPGNYTVEESGNANGYLTGTKADYWEWNASGSVTVAAGSNATFQAENLQSGKLTIRKTMEGAGPVEGWQFIIKDSNGDPIDGSPFTSDASGLVFSGMLLPGKYTVEEIIPADSLYYCKSENPVTIEVRAGEDAEATFINASKSGALNIIKTSSTGTVQGWRIGIYTDAECTIPVAAAGTNGYFVTDVDGYIYVADIESGTYYVRELPWAQQNRDLFPEDQKDFWVLDTSVKMVTISANTTAFVEIENTYYGKLTIIKTTNTGNDLDGWSFKVWNEDGSFEKIYTIADGEDRVTTENLLPGTYFVQEQGIEDTSWICDLTAHEITVVAGENAEQTIHNEQKALLTVVKTVIGEGPLAGWQFNIYDADGNPIEGSPFTSDDTGLVFSGYLDSGKYMIEEIIPEDSAYYCTTENPVEVELIAGTETPVTFTNALKTARIVIEKIDTSGHHLEGVEFLLEWSEDGQNWNPIVSAAPADPDAPADPSAVFAPVKGETTTQGVTDGHLVTDENGFVYFEGLYPDLYYRVTETKTLNGYNLLTKPIFEGQLNAENEYCFQDEVVNSYSPVIPQTGIFDDTYTLIAGGSCMATLALLLLLSMMLGKKTNVCNGRPAVQNKNQFVKEKSTMKKTASRLFSLLLVLSLVASLAVPTFAAPPNPAAETTSVIDTSKTGSMHIYKYDFTNAQKDGVWDDSYVSTGVYDADVNNTLGGSKRAGDTDNISNLGNGQTSNGYAIKGVEFTYLKVAEIVTFSESANDGQTYNHIEVLYGINKNAGAALLTALDLKPADRYENADGLDASGNTYYFQSDVLINALRKQLQDNATSTKNALEAYVKSDAVNAKQMELTDENGYTYADKLELGLYLVVETKVPEMVTNTTNPFFVSVPMTSVNGDNANDGGDRWIYDITLYPKNETSIASLEKTVRESMDDTGKNDATSVITDGFAHVATGSAGDIMEYQIISTLPSITSAATYLSAYNFTDELSAGLTYVKNNTTAVQIQWFVKSDCTGDPVATWNMADGKFTVSYEPAETIPASSSKMLITMTAKGLEEINTSTAVYGTDEVRRGYSDLTMRITYTATIDSDTTTVYGDSGNPNTVVLTWQRTSSAYFDTLVDDCHVYTYGIDLTKTFSDAASLSKDELNALYPEVQFVLWNATDGYWVKAALNADEGIYYVVDHMVEGGVSGHEDGAAHAGLKAEEAAKAAQATVFTPVATSDAAAGKIIIMGLEDDTYILTEINTADGYTLLKDHITIVISTEATADTCDIYTHQDHLLGVIQNDPRYLDIVAAGNVTTVLGLKNMPQKPLSHTLLTASATVDGNDVTMLEDDSASVNAIAPLAVVNTHGFDLPQTGEFTATLMPIVGGGIVAVCLLAICVLLLKRKDEEEEQTARA